MGAENREWVPTSYPKNQRFHLYVYIQFGILFKMNSQFSKDSPN